MRFPATTRTSVILAAAAAAVLVVAGVGLAAQPWQNECDSVTDARQVSDIEGSVGYLLNVEGDGDADYAVLGDSISAGYGIDEPDLVWMQSLAVSTQTTIEAHAFADTGFVNAGPCGEHAFADRIDPLLDSLAGSDLLEDGTLFVQGGMEDAGATPEQVEDAAASVMARLQEGGDWRVVLLGPMDAPALDGEQDIDQALARAAEEADVQYLSMIGLLEDEFHLGGISQDDLFQSDGIHLNDLGQEAFGSEVTCYVAC